jgi:hypothetical protein
LFVVIGFGAAFFSFSAAMPIDADRITAQMTMKIPTVFQLLINFSDTIFSGLLLPEFRSNLFALNQDCLNISKNCNHKITIVKIEELVKNRIHQVFGFWYEIYDAISAC